MAQKPSYAAPNLSDLSDLQEEQKVMNPSVRQPTVQVIAAGGCGQNILKAILKCNPQFDAKINYRVIDTSASNVSGIPQ